MAIALIPAAGSSRRMGRPKLLLPFPLADIAAGAGDASTILGATVAALRAGGAVRICVVGRAGDAELAGWVEEHADAFAVVHAVNPHPERGMLSTIVAGLAALGGAEALAAAGEPLLVTPGDLPRLRAATVAAVLARLAAGGAGLAVPIHEGRRGHPLAIAARLVPEIPGLDLAVGLRLLLDRHAADVAEVTVDDPGAIHDVDTPEDYRGAIGE